MSGLYISIVILALFWGFGAAYGHAKSFDIKSLKQNYEHAISRSNDPSKASRFLDSFPQNAWDFKKAFESKKIKSSDATSYIFFLEKTLNTKPKDTMRLVLGLAANLKYRAGVVDRFQMVAGKICAREPRLFAEVFNKLTPHWQENVVLFLKAGPKGPAVGFNTLVIQLEHQGFETLVEKLKVIQ